MKAMCDGQSAVAISSGETALKITGQFLVLSILTGTVLTGLSACAPNPCARAICDSGNAAYQQFTPEEITTMTGELDALAKTPGQ